MVFDSTERQKTNSWRLVCRGLTSFEQHLYQPHWVSTSLGLCIDIESINCRLSLVTLIDLNCITDDGVGSSNLGLVFFPFTSSSSAPSSSYYYLSSQSSFIPWSLLLFLLLLFFISSIPWSLLLLQLLLVRSPLSISSSSSKPTTHPPPLTQPPCW